MKTYRLSNGLTLVVQSDRSLPLVTLDMWVRVGSGDEPRAMAGASHFLEHMLFKGTQRLPVGEYDRRIEAAGGYLNAGTAMDFTHYYVSFPSAHFDAVLTDFADVLSNSTLDPVEVERERQVILEEIRRKNDNPFGFLFDETVPSLYTAGPYRHTVLGSKDTVSALTRDQLFEHYQRFYAPANMTLVVAGAVDPEATHRQVQAAFGALDRPLRPWHATPEPVAFSPAAERHLTRDFKELYFIFSFPGPAEQGVEQAASLDVLEAVLTGGRASRLVKVLQEEKALVSSISAYMPTSRHGMPLMIYGTCEPGKVEAVRQELSEQLRRLARDGVTADELSRSKRQVANAQLYAVETNNGRAGSLGYSYVLLGGPELATRYQEAVARTSEEAVIAVARQWLRPEAASLTTTGRREAAP